MISKICKNCSKTFTIAPEDQAFYQKIAVPKPTHCPDCRLQRRMAWRNDRNLYERTCDFSGEKLISMFPPEAKVKVYHKDIWWSDKWDGRTYGRDFDFSRSFFEQFHELNKEVPHPHTITIAGENNLYTNYTGYNKNCYLCFAGNYLEDSMYSYNAQNSRDCVDCLFVYDSELCYQCVQSEKCYNCAFTLHSKNCSDSFFIEDCSDCQNCFLSFNLNRKQYYILNKPYSKEEYFRVLKSYKLNTLSGQQKAFALWRNESKKYPKRANHNVLAENCSGEYILQSKNCHNCYTMAKGGEDSTYIFNGFPSLKDSYDCTYAGEHAELLYESMCTGDNVFNAQFCNIGLTGSSYLQYCNFVVGSQHCFGCSNLKNAKYCILNKQYTQAEYEALVPKIIEHMKKLGEYGEFFPAQFSPFAYNESFVQEYFPLSKDEVIAGGYQWREADPKFYKPQNFQVVDCIQEVRDDILNEVLACRECGKNFRIVKQELQFYRKLQLPIPNSCFDCRHKMRVGLRNPRKLFSRTCDKCKVPLESTYSSDRPEKVYCENCYLAEVY